MQNQAVEMMQQHEPEAKFGSPSFKGTDINEEDNGQLKQVNILSEGPAGESSETIRGTPMPSPPINTLDLKIASLPINMGVSSTVVYEYKIDGMTCVACSSAIERGLNIEFQGKGLVEGSLNVILLMHKMKISFYKEEALKNNIDSSKIVEEVEELGFNATLLNTYELNQGNTPRSSRSNLGDIVVEEKIKTSSFQITGMTCAACSGAIERHFGTAVPGCVNINVSLLTHKAQITYDYSKIKPRAIIEEISDLGFEAQILPENEGFDIREIVAESVRKFKSKLIICLIIYFPIAILIWLVPYVEVMKPFMTNMIIWNGNPLYTFINAILATIIQFYQGYSFYISAYKSLRHKSANMDVLIVIGTTAAWLYGIILIFIGYPERELASMKFHMKVHSHVHNFETSAILITIVLAGKYIETFSKMKTIDKLSQLASLKVTKANLIKEKDQNKLTLNSDFEEVPVELLEIKDFVMIQPGGAIPTDGLVVFGRGCCNESMLTGEAQPIQKEIGQKVFGGTILTQGSLIIKVEKIAEDATFNQIMKLVEDAQNTKAPIQGYADKISSVFVPAIVVLAIISWIVWFSIVYSDTDESIIQEGTHLSKFQFAFDFGISSLVVACPCALGLATPTAVMVGTGLAASYGVLIKGADVLEKIKNIDTIVFDKTGTLTSGKPQVKDILNCKQTFKVESASDNNAFLYELIYLAESSSEHPIAISICDQIKRNIGVKAENLDERYEVKEFKNQSGEGIESTIRSIQDNETYEILCGNNKLMQRHKILENYSEIARQTHYLEEEGKTVILLAMNKVPQLILSLQEAHLSKPESKYVVDYLQYTMKVKVCMITGDNKFSALKVARHLGIATENVTYQAYPETKQQVVEKYQAEGRKVMFVGDGINDSPVLAQSDVGCAINSASDITVSAAGIVLIKDDLLDVLRAVLIAQKSFNRIKINFFLAFIYNIILIPIALGIFYPIDKFKLDPMYAALAMGLSSISVVSSSLMLKLYNPNSDLQNIDAKKKVSQVQNYLKLESQSKSDPETPQIDKDKHLGSSTPDGSAFTSVQTVSDGDLEVDNRNHFQQSNQRSAGRMNFASNN